MAEHTTEYTDVNGTPFTEADIERWAAETEQGYAGKHLSLIHI